MKVNADQILKSICLLLLTVTHFSECWTVKILNLTDEKITVNINSSQIYPGWDKGPVKRRCEFIGEQIDAHESRDFNYKNVNSICVGPCTKSVDITSPVKLSAENKLTSCSNVFVVVRKDASNKWSMQYNDWTNNVTKMIEERKRMPKNVKIIYDRFGRNPIQALSVFRKPIKSGIKELVETITKDELKRLHYDTLYHTGFIIKCNNQLIQLERNQTVTNKIMSSEDQQDVEQMNIVLPKTMYYDEFINKAMADDPNFWKYDPVNNNCQLFVLQCLEKNDIELSEDLHNFIYQNANEVLAKSPVLKNVARGVTSLANRIDRIVEGISDVTIQNGTPYTLRVRTRYVGESKRLKICRADDFLLESGGEKNVSHGICLLESIKVAGSSKGIDTIKAVPHDQLQKSADIFAEKSFVRGKVSATFLIRSVESNKISIENIGNQNLSTEELQKLAKKPLNATTKMPSVKTKN